MGIILGKYLIFSGHSNLEAESAGLSAAQKAAFNKEVLLLTLKPYKYILFVLLVLLVLVAITKMPYAKAKTDLAAAQGGAGVKQPSLGESINYLLHNTRFMKVVGAQFLYVEIQTCVWSFTIRLALRIIPGITDHTATNYMIISYGV